MENFKFNNRIIDLGRLLTADVEESTLGIFLVLNFKDENKPIKMKYKDRKEAIEDIDKINNEIEARKKEKEESRKKTIQERKESMEKRKKYPR